MGGEEACFGAVLAVVLFTLMVFSGVALTSVGPEQEIEIPLTLLINSNSGSGSAAASVATPLPTEGPSSSTGGEIFRSMTIEVQFDVDNRGDLLFKQKRAKTRETGAEVVLDRKGNGKRVNIPFAEVFDGVTNNKGSKVPLTYSEFASSRIGTAVVETVFGDGFGDGVDYNQTAVSEWIFENKFQWLCPNYYFQIEDKLHQRWQAALLRFLPQILFPPIWIVLDKVMGGTGGAIVGFIGSVISLILMLTGVIIEFAGLSKLNALLDPKGSTGSTTEFCGNGFSARPTLGSQGFVPEMNGVGLPTSAGLTFIPILVCSGVLVYGFSKVSPKSCCKDEEEEDV